MAIDTERTHTLLIARREELTARLKELDRHSRHREEPLPADFSEQATELEDREVQDALGDESRDELRQVNRALDRLARGSYGSCEDCGAGIPEGRLDALPFATRCIRCAA